MYILIKIEDEFYPEKCRKWNTQNFCIINLSLSHLGVAYMIWLPIN